MMRPGVPWSRIAQALEAHCAAAGCGIVTEYVGHGIGRDLHEPPKAPAYWSGFAGEDFVLEAGLVLAVEPMLTQRLPEGPARTPVCLRPDGWTVATRDGSAACHEERTIAVTARGAVMLGLAATVAW